MTGAPATPGTVTGWRVWHVETTPRAVQLRSWSQPGIWPARHRFQARCHALPGLASFRRPHRTPQRGHACGIYACREREDAQALLEALGPVGPEAGRMAAAVGRVSLWGRVIENTGGWRGEFAYPYEVVLFGGDREMAAELRARYAIDVSLA